MITGVVVGASAVTTIGEGAVVGRLVRSVLGDALGDMLPAVTVGTAVVGGGGGSGSCGQGAKAQLGGTRPTPVPSGQTRRSNVQA